MLKVATWAVRRSINFSNSKGILQKAMSTEKNLPGLTDEQVDYDYFLQYFLIIFHQLNKIRDADVYYRYKHIEIEASLRPEEHDIVRRKRMIYRSKQRGWLEADLLLGIQ